jgi:ribosomal protein S9
MPFDWREYLNLAQSLQGHSGGSFSQEAAFRCAVSRAYFAAFCHARNFARDRQSFKPSYKADDHYLLKQYFRKTGRTEIARKLDCLREWRNNCDYDDDVSNINRMLNDAIKHSSDIFEKIY